MKLTKEQKLAQFWNHNINPITGWASTTRLDNEMIDRKTVKDNPSSKKRKKSSVGQLLNI
tara:strand:- start:610 stop:789 length:180 start_codon:yes stop_codon:yes gene_type:complete